MRFITIISLFSIILLSCQSTNESNRLDEDDIIEFMKMSQRGYENENTYKTETWLYLINDFEDEFEKIRTIEMNVAFSMGFTIVDGEISYNVYPFIFTQLNNEKNVKMYAIRHSVYSRNNNFFNTNKIRLLMDDIIIDLDISYKEQNIDNINYNSSVYEEEIVTIVDEKIFKKFLNANKIQLKIYGEDNLFTFIFNNIDLFRISVFKEYLYEKYDLIY